MSARPVPDRRYSLGMMFALLTVGLGVVRLIR